MRTYVAAALLLAVAGCAGSSNADPAPKLTVTQAVDRTCAEVREGIAAFNQHDYSATVQHFVTARTTAKINAKINPKPEADALLDAVEYYANLDPADYPEAARTSESFARNKAITLSQCASDGSTDDGVPTQKT